MEAEVVRAALGHLPDERVAGELQREIARRLRWGVE